MIRRAAASLLCLMLTVLFLLPASAQAESPAEKEAKVVRVGWYDSPFNHKDSFGRRTGYAYEYQRKIAAYTGWKYEYIEGTWPELMQMLKDGRVDLMSDVSYMEERTEHMLYASLPMGEELYYLYVAAGNTEISPEDAATLNGKRVGITAGSIQKSIFLEWAENHGVTVEILDLKGSETESLEMLTGGKMDAFVTLDSYYNPEAMTPLWKIGSSDFYFALSKRRADLLPELDMAMNRIQDENKHYNEQLTARHLSAAGINHYLTAEEKDWLSSHGPIRIGYQDNYLAFCAADPETGELTGALKDYLAFASGVLGNASPQFEAVAFPTAAAAIEALANGEVDCMFPANLTDYDGEQAGVVMTPPLMRTEMDAVVREADRQDFLRKSQIRVGVNRGNPNYEMFLREHYPDWTPVYYADTPACLDAVAAKNADCIIISNYRFRDISRQCEKLNLVTVYTGVDMDYCFGVREGNTTLYSILSRIIAEVPDATVNAALTYYSAAAAKPGFFDVLLDEPAAWISAAAAAAILILLALRNVRMAKKLREQNASRS